MKIVVLTSVGERQQTVHCVTHDRLDRGKRRVD